MTKEEVKARAIESLRFLGLHDLMNTCEDLDPEKDVVENHNETHLIVRRNDNTEVSICVRDL